MLTLHPNRSTILTVSLALFLSSVGLPVIVVACEMGTMVMTMGCGGACRKATEPGERITSIPCQMQCRFVEANTTAYVPAKRGGDQQPLQVLALLSHVSSVVGLISPLSCNPSESSPRTRDIPILTSTLLI